MEQTAKFKSPFIVIHKNIPSFLKLITLLFLGLISSNTTAQESTKENGLRNKLPIVSIAPGVFHFLGDIGYSKLNQPFLSKPGFQIELQLQTKSRLSFAAFLLSGKVFGEETDRNKSLNFKASLVTEGIMLRYDLLNRKRSDQTLVPYVTVGIEYVIFHTFADLKDASGQTYQYWSDGTVRDIAQSDTAAYRAIKLHRDYTYETDMRDANLDGFGKYNQSALSFPVGAGVRFIISPRVSMHLSSVWHLVGSDLIDGVSKAGSGERKGNSKNDKIIFSSVALRYDLSSNPGSRTKKGYRPDKAEVRDIDFNALANEDADMDGIPDIKDDSSATPASKEVDKFGKPLDKDDDGIPDYRDLELNSAPNAVVTVDGVTITEEMIEDKFRTDSLAAIPALVEYIQSYDRLIQRKPGLEQEQLDKLNEEKPFRDKIPALYRALDVDGNEYISPKEISNAIDDYMEGKSSYTIPEFYNLIDFFFMQK